MSLSVRVLAGWLLTACLLCGATGLAVPAAGTAVTQTDSPEPDSVLLDITVERNGDARWLVEYRARLDDANDTAAFDAYADDIEKNTSRYRDRFTNRMEATVADAANATGRPMRVENVTVATRTEGLPTTYGVVAYRFHWTGFAVTDDDQLWAGDAIAGLFLDSRTTLVLRGPPEYRAVAATPEPDRLGRAATWVGPASFGAAEPRVSFEPAPVGSPTPTTTDGDASGGTGSANAPATDADPGRIWLVGVGLLVVGLAALAVGYRGRESGAGPDPDDDGAGDGAATAGTVAGDAGTGEGVGSGSPAGPELLSNEEQVLQLLADRGRMKQQTLAEELDWTASKTSKVVTSLREDGRVETFRAGRENVVEPAIDEDI